MKKQSKKALKELKEYGDLGFGVFKYVDVGDKLQAGDEIKHPLLGWVPVSFTIEKIKDLPGWKVDESVVKRGILESVVCLYPKTVRRKADWVDRYNPNNPQTVLDSLGEEDPVEAEKLKETQEMLSRLEENARVLLEGLKGSSSKLEPGQSVVLKTTENAPQA